ncbi:MAG: hypothetical protein H0Z24_06835 [Thermosipho sp. (in: Bacteria)]|nr:hypothetical protein [Thermosipho sp. (in: thermotogales)]
MDIELKLSTHPYLILVKTNVYEIPERLKEYDDSFFVVFNTRTKKYEVHSTDNIGNTYCLTVPYNELDCRTLELVKRGDIKARGMKAIIREIDEHNEKIEKKNKREFHNWVQDVARETQWHFRKAFI